MFNTPAENFAWLVGLLEGEGTWYAGPTGPPRKDGSRYLRPRIALKMTDEDIVRRAHSVAGVGRVDGPYQYRDDRKPAWVWTVSGYPDVTDLLVLLIPHLGERRKEQAIKVIDAVVAYELTFA